MANLKKKSPNRMDKVHLANAKLTAMYVRNVVKLEKQMKVKMATILKEKQKVEIEYKEQKREKLRLKNQPRIGYNADKGKGKPTRSVKPALRSPSKTSRSEKRVAFTGVADDTDDSESENESDDQSKEQARPNLIFSGLTPSRRTQMSMVEEMSTSEEDSNEERPPEFTFRNAFSSRRRSSCNDERDNVNSSPLALSSNSSHFGNHTTIIPMTTLSSTFTTQPNIMSLKAQAFQTEMRMVKPEVATDEVQHEFSGRFTRRRSRSAIMSDVMKMRRQVGYRSPSAPPMKNREQGSIFTGGLRGFQKSETEFTSSSDWNRQTREKLNDPRKAYKLPSLVVDESETSAFFVNGLHQEKKVNEDQTLLFLRKVDQTRENEQLNKKLHQYFANSTKTTSNDMDHDDLISEEEEKMMFERVRGLRNFIQS